MATAVYVRVKLPRAVGLPHDNPVLDRFLHRFAGFRGDGTRELGALTVATADEVR